MQQRAGAYAGLERKKKQIQLGTKFDSLFEILTNTDPMHSTVKK
jgi:hypothetical protein